MIRGVVIIGLIGFAAYKIVQIFSSDNGYRTRPKTKKHEKSLEKQSIGNYTAKSKKGNVVKFNSKPFAEGSIRYAFLGKIVQGPNKGEQGVVKTFKDKRLREQKDQSQKQLSVYNKAAQMSVYFNRQLKDNGFNASITFPLPDLVKLEKIEIKNQLYFKEGDWVCMEKFLSGFYEKWTNNYGWMKKGKDSQIPQAFQHYTYAKSNTCFLICDIQGIRNGDHYILTDPAINSNNRQYGATDMGQDGCLMVLANHKCNKYCQKLKLPVMQMDQLIYYIKLINQGKIKLSKGTVDKYFTGI